MFDGLPEKCFSCNPSDENSVTVIYRGEKGYALAMIDGLHITGGKAQAALMNKNIGVTPAQAEAMLARSMFGWDVPGANPNAYNEDGSFNKNNTLDKLKGKVVFQILEMICINNNVFAAGPITKQPGTTAYRIVLRKLNGNHPFVVHTQHFPNYEVDFPDFSKNYFSNGTYFTANELTKAVECFGKKIVENAVFLASLYME